MFCQRIAGSKISEDVTIGNVQDVILKYQTFSE
jgi:hypothetical protein